MLVVIWMSSLLRVLHGELTPKSVQAMEDDGMMLGEGGEQTITHQD
jgi:hypothetical protein